MYRRLFWLVCFLVSSWAQPCASQSVPLFYVPESCKTSEKIVPVVSSCLSAPAINLVWQHAQKANVDLSQLPKIPGLNVVSPCWYKLSSPDGRIKGQEAPGYTAAAQKQGYKVWPLITSSFDPDLFHQVLVNAQARQFLISQLQVCAQKEHWEGLNIDFENIRDEDKDRLTDFVGEICRELHKQHLIISMDVTLPSNTPFWSACYDRPALAGHLDYLILMAYDQYTPSMKKAGPTAAFDWVENGLQNTLAQQVPAAKIILGMPLYMRLWSTDLVSQQTKGQTLTMDGAEKLTTAKSLLPTWKSVYNHQQGLMHCSYQEEQKQYDFWFEDANSLRKKAFLSKKYGLAGIASWRKGFETPDVWPELADLLAK